MYKIRIGNDLKISWKIMKNNVPYNLEGKDIIVYMLDSTKRKVVIEYTVKENVVSVIYRGMHQYEIGCYALVLVENRDAEGMVTVDYQKVFELVKHSAQADCTDGMNNVMIEVPEISSDIEHLVDLSNYFTKQEINDMFAGIKVPTKVSELENDANYINEHQSLAGYATESYVNGKVGEIKVPTKVSELQNDANYINEHQSLAGYATESYVNGQGFIKNDALTGYATESYVGEQIDVNKPKEWIGTQEEYDALGVYDTDTKYYITDQGINVYATKEYVDGKVGEIKVPTKVSELQNDANYLTEHQSLVGYATESYVGEQINANKPKEWIGTQQEYDALGVYDAETKYYITK